MGQPSWAGNFDILESDRACREDADCKVVYLNCGDCVCEEVAVNKIFEEKYQSQARQYCQDHPTGICDNQCFKNLSSQCVDNLCVVSQVNINPSRHPQSAQGAHSWHIKQMKEKFFQDGEHRLDQQYRLFVISGWGDTRMYRIEKLGEQYQLVVKKSTGGGKYNFVETTRTITVQEWNQFFDLINKALFWKMAQQDYSKIGFDGTTYVLEASNQGQYHAVERWQPDEGSFKDVCDYLLRIAEGRPAAVNLVRPAIEAQKYIEINPEHKACNADQGCTVVETDCLNYCSCGPWLGVNRQFVKHYEELLAQCRLGLPVPKDCQVACRPFYARCVDGFCKEAGEK